VLRSCERQRGSRESNPERIRRIAYGGYSEDEESRAMDMTAFTLGQMEEALQGGDWIVGDYSLADISLFALTHRLGELDAEIFDASRFPGVVAWHKRMLARAAVAHIMQPGTAETPAKTRRSACRDWDSLYPPARGKTSVA